MSLWGSSWGNSGFSGNRDGSERPKRGHNKQCTRASGDGWGFMKHNDHCAGCRYARNNSGWGINNRPAAGVGTVIVIGSLYGGSSKKSKGIWGCSKKGKGIWG